MINEIPFLPPGKKEVAFAAPYPGSIIAVDLKDVNGEILCQKDAFLCAAMGTNVSIAFNKRIGAGFFGGEGFILQKLRGDGMAFLHAGGTIVEKELNNIFEPTVKLKSGGYLVINPTEALVAIDINSGQSTKQINIEKTALNTNLEAAEEISRQIKLRDLSGLIAVSYTHLRAHET